MRRALFTVGMLVALDSFGGMMTEWGERVTPENAWREYPRPQMERVNWTNLNGLWQYAVTSKSPGIPKKWDGEILVPFPIESALSRVGRLLEGNETLWYRRTFTAAVKPGTRLLLNFEQCDLRTQVLVNGVEVGLPHEGGQIPFSFDITRYVVSGENELVVSVWDPTDSIASYGKQTLKPHGCLYTRCSGIGGTVWLESVPETHISEYRTTPCLDAASVSVEVRPVGDTSGATAKIVVSRSGRKIAEKSVSRFDVPATIQLPKPVAEWSPETPNLYDLEIVLADREGRLDAVKGYFGMRKIEKRRDANGILRFYFNNKPRFLLGTLDQGWWPDGLLTPPSEAAMKFDILKLKEFGYDMMRKHIKVEPRRYYHLCDKLGIIVLQDMPSGFGNAEPRYGFYRRELKEMIDHLHNVVSIVMWIPYNEQWGQPGEFLTHSTLAWVGRYDPSRLVDGASGANDYEGGALWCTKPYTYTKHLPISQEEAGDCVDMHDYGSAPAMFPVNERRISFLGEFGGIGCRVADHLWTTNAWGYGNTGDDVDRKFVQGKFAGLMHHIAYLARKGLGGSVYTQTTDVEAEINGLITYDRKCVKFDAAALAAAHAEVRRSLNCSYTPVEERAIMPKLDPNPKAWAWTTDEPKKGWQTPQFDDSAWRRSAGGFGNPEIAKRHPEAKVSSAWNTKNLWLRRHFICETPVDEVMFAVLEIFHDENAEIWINGEKVVNLNGYNCRFDRTPIPIDRLRKALKQGDNVLAVKVSQTVGDQYFDVGMIFETAVDLGKISECRPRKGTPNALKKLQRGDTVRIGYLGGSITMAGNGWRSRTMEWFRQEYPAAKIIEVNAAISGTGSDFGAVRMAEDVLSQKPDLLFVEFRVNGSAGFDYESTEGIVRQAIAANPEMDICFVYTLAQNMVADMKLGRQTHFGRVMEEVCEHYGISSIDFAPEIIERLKDPSKFIFSPAKTQSGGDSDQGKTVFAKDGVHPGSEGHEIYSEVVARAFRERIFKVDAKPGARTMPTRLRENAWERCEMVPAARVLTGREWKKVADGEHDPIYGASFDRTSVMLRGGMETTKEGATFTVNWEGTTIGISDIPQSQQGTEPMIIEVSIDGGAPLKFERRRTREKRIYSRFAYLPQQKFGKHTAFFTVKRIPDGQRCILGQFLIVGRRLEDR